MKKRIEGPRLGEILDWVFEDLTLQQHIYDYIIAENGIADEIPEEGGDLFYDFDEDYRFVLEYYPEEKNANQAQ